MGNIGQVSTSELLLHREQNQLVVMVDEILELTDKLKDKSPGLDGMSSRVFEALTCGIADLLTEICSLSLKLTTLVGDWKTGK